MKTSYPHSSFFPQKIIILEKDYVAGPHYGALPPGSVPPPLLVLDLEKTLIGSVYDVDHGWRHVKRPGLKKFIDRITQYYEVLIISENDLNPDIFMAVDPENKCHKHGAVASEARNGILLKRLDLMNRDLSRIILIDDNPKAAELYPRNSLYIKPFTNINDKSDRALEDLIDLLQAIVHDGVDDIRDTLDDLGTHDADEAVTEYRMRLFKRKQKDQEKRDRGIGSLIRKSSAFATVAGSSVPAEAPSSSSSSSIIPSSSSGDGDDLTSDSAFSLSRIVGKAPEAVSSSSKPSSSSSGGSTHKEDVPKEPAVKKKGMALQWLEDSEKQNEEYEMRKMERMNEIHAKRMREKAQKEEDLRRKAQEGL